MPLSGPVGTDEFAGLLGPLGPFEPHPRLAAGVSGGADSMALCLLADVWARARGGSVVALIVDHGLRAGSAEEARTVRARLATRGVAADILSLAGLAAGAAVSARAREARFAALEQACARQGILHLLLGHHAGDQAETRLIRERAGSGAAGLACMAALRETDRVRIVRPLLAVAPERLRATLEARGQRWVEDPSNRDEGYERVRVRPAACADRSALWAAARSDALARSGAEDRAAGELAGVAIRPEGFAVVPAGALSPAAWSALIQTIGGAAYPPPPEAVARLVAHEAPCTLAGARIALAGRHGPGFLVMREEAAVAPPAPASDGARWDGRFRLSGEGGCGLTVGALGEDVAAFRKRSDLPAAMLRTLPAIRDGRALAAVPHLGAPSRPHSVRVAFDPPRPAAGAPFVTAA